MKKLSIIIPSYNDKRDVIRLVRQITNQKVPSYEIIVIESGKTNYKNNLPKSVKFFLTTKKGRAEQMNLGTFKSKSPLLLFLHADSDISSINLKSISNIKEKNYWGCFKIAFDSKNHYFRFVELTSNFRKMYLKLPFGDQGLILSKKLFNQVGGFPLGGFEDVDISKKLRKFANPRMIKQPIITSPRRFIKHGIIKTHLIMALIMISYVIYLKKISKSLYSLIR